MSREEPPIGDGVDASVSEDAEVARVLDEYLAALEAGRPADPEGLLAEHPAIASQLRGCLEVMHLAGRVAVIGEGILEVDDDARPGPRLDDYRIIRQIGRGGMGIVYEAEQLSLRRRVALKVLPLASAIDPRQLRRFHVEAQAAAHLHHTHIVPVHAVGCERGVHYYAMQYIEGKSLAELIRELRQIEGREAAEQAATVVIGGDRELAALMASGQLAPPEKVAVPEAAAAPPAARPPAGATGPARSSSSRTAAYFRTVANLGVQAAEALEHAHQEGVVHRDIKPANVMVDTRGHLWITDFGLARLQNDAGMTMSGDLVGTIRYMSPEQAIGHRAVVDQRTDIYALGVTLYELLALEPAFDGSDRREVLRRIIEEGPRPLRAPAPAVPRELETIIRKATDREPESRYPTMQELADDLRRFLEYRPIRARRPTLFECVAKWSRRHRAVVGSAVVILILTAVGLAISTATIAAKQAEVIHQRDEAHRQEGRARRILDELYTGLSERWLAQDPGDAELRREFLQKAAAYYEEFARASGRTLEDRLDVAHAWLRVGRVCWSLRRVPEGESAYRQAMSRFAELAAEGRVDAIEARNGELYAAYRLGDLVWVAGREAEAAACYSRSIDLARSALAHRPDHLGVRINLAAALMSQGNLKHDPGILIEAEAAWRAVLSDLISSRVDIRPLVEQFRNHRIVIDTPFPEVAATIASRGDTDDLILAGVYLCLGTTLDYLGKISESEECYRRSLAAFPAPAERASHRERRPRSIILRTSAGALYRAGRYRDAVRAYRDALALVPNDPKAHEGLAVLLADCPDPALRDPQEAIRVARRGVDLVPDDGHIWRALGMAYYRAGRWTDAPAALDRGISLHGCEMRDALFLAMTHWRLGHPEEAHKWYTRGVGKIKPSEVHAGATVIDPEFIRLRDEASALLGMTDGSLAVKDGD